MFSYMASKFSHVGGLNINETQMPSVLDQLLREQFERLVKKIFILNRVGTILNKSDSPQILNGPSISAKHSKSGNDFEHLAKREVPFIVRRRTKD